MGGKRKGILRKKSSHVISVLLAVMNWRTAVAFAPRRRAIACQRTYYRTISLHHLPRWTCQSPSIWSLQAKVFDRRSFYSLEDMGANDRPVPPTLGGTQDEDDIGYGDYDESLIDPEEFDRIIPGGDYIMSNNVKTEASVPESLNQQEEKPSPEPPLAVETSSSDASPSPDIVDPFNFDGPHMQKKDPPKAIQEPAEKIVDPFGFGDIVVNDVKEEVEQPKPAASTIYKGIESVPPSHIHAAQEPPDSDLSDFLVRAASGNGASTQLDMLDLQLSDLVARIYEENNGKEFNLNSPRQVSLVLFDAPAESTKKDVLEGMAAGGNSMADLVLKYRALQQQIKRTKSKQESIKKGTRVRSASVPTKATAVTSTSSMTETGSHEEEPLLLVDASSYIFRAYYSMPPIHRSDGLPTGAVMGFCNMLNRLVLNRMLEPDQPAARLVLVFDAKGKTFRHDLYNEYKGHRPEAPVDLIPQFSLIRQAAIAYGIPQIEAPNYEADDVIATLARMAQEEGIASHILSGDKDLMQLVSADGVEPIIHMIDPVKMERVTAQEVREKWGVEPDLLGDVLALAGDAADNIPGVPGIGPKTAALLLDQFGTLDNLLENIDQVKQKGRRTKLEANVDKARLSRKLVELDRHVPIDRMTNFPEAGVNDFRVEAMDADRLLNFFDEMSFRDLKRRVAGRLDGLSRKRKSYSNNNRKPKVELPKPEEFEDVPF